MPVITLTSDIGNNDFVIGALKGQLVTSNPYVNIIDINHNIAPYNYIQAAYMCRSSFQFFPNDTVHLILVDVFHNERISFVIARFGKYWIVCPNHGLLTMITGAMPDDAAVVEIPKLPSMHLLHITQHITGVIQQAISGVQLAQLHTKGAKIVEKYPLRATIGPDWMEAQIMFIDNYENVVVNITHNEFEEARKGRNFIIEFTRNQITKLSTSYADAQMGEAVAWFNAAGYLELAINHGKMASLFGLRGITDYTMKNRSSDRLFYESIRVFFR
ncbi:MAG TPA: hypothetical protein DCL43_12705 [Chitinophagaceae bacterium]|nr:hypothetical protein [Chitinophagaceae bacterium]HAN37572.1 hypothetical protein [Chitinophagaceae bacterium]